MNGYFSIAREHIDAFRVSTANDVKLYVYLVSAAAFRDSPLCPKGCLFDSLEGLALRSGLTVKEVRNSLKNLENSELIHQNGQLEGKAKKRHDIEINRYVAPGEVFRETGNWRATEGQLEGNQRARLEEVRSKNEKDTPAHARTEWRGEKSPATPPEPHPNVRMVQQVFGPQEKVPEPGTAPLDATPWEDGAKFFAEFRETLKNPPLKDAT